MDTEARYRAIESRDRRFDGWFVACVTSTGIYCRPSCPALTPKRAHVEFRRTAAAAQTAGFRACKRCQPDAVPGSPEWDVRADVVGRAMRLIADGVVDRHGVEGLADRLGYSVRHVHRTLVAEVGAGPQALARAQRAHAARILLETTDVPVTQVALAAGFGSLRQCNDTIRQVFAAAPSALRAGSRRDRAAAPGRLTLRLPYRDPCDADGLWDFLGARAVPGVEEVTTSEGGAYRRTLRLPHGTGVVELAPGDGHVRCTLELDDLRDVSTAVARSRRLLDLDADPQAIAAHLRGDPLLRPLARARPGRRSPGTVDGSELAIRAVLGQQVSIAAARTLAGRLVARLGAPLPSPSGGLTHLFPTMEALAQADPEHFAMPQARRRALQALAAALADGRLTVDPGSDRRSAERELRALPGIGPWTAAYVRMRALGDPDVFLASDVGVRHALDLLGAASNPRAAAARAASWSPWRSYAQHHLWAALSPRSSSPVRSLESA